MIIVIAKARSAALSEGPCCSSYLLIQRLAFARKPFGHKANESYTRDVVLTGSIGLHPLHEFFHGRAALRWRIRKANPRSAGVLTLGLHYSLGKSVTEIQQANIGWIVRTCGASEGQVCGNARTLPASSKPLVADAPRMSRICCVAPDGNWRRCFHLVAECQGLTNPTSASTVAATSVSPPGVGRGARGIGNS